MRPKNEATIAPAVADNSVKEDPCWLSGGIEPEPKFHFSLIFQGILRERVQRNTTPGLSVRADVSQFCNEKQ